MVIVTSIALAPMSLNHLLLPASYPDPAMNLYRWILWGRRLLIGTIIMAGYGFYAGLKHSQGLVELGLISFVAVAQFLPGIVSCCTGDVPRSGFIIGLLGGIGVWSMLLLTHRCTPGDPDHRSRHPAVCRRQRRTSGRLPPSSA